MQLASTKISIIFPSYNGERFLQRNLESIKSLNNLDEVELIIIDNRSNDSSIKLIKSFENQINIKLISIIQFKKKIENIRLCLHI